MFSEAEEKDIKELVELYSLVKPLILFCEENHEDFKSNLHTVKELRDAFDHVMRVFAVKLQIKEEKDAGYIKINTDKALGHVYRAGYDTLDYAGIILRDKINKEVSGFSPSALQVAIPTYYSEMRPSIEVITSDIIQLRNNKDIASPNPVAFNQYFKHIEDLQGIYKTILKSKPALVEYDTKNKKEKLLHYLILGFITFVIGIIVKSYF